MGRANYRAGRCNRNCLKDGTGRKILQGERHRAATDKSDDEETHSQRLRSAAGGTSGKANRESRVSSCTTGLDDEADLPVSTTVAEAPRTAAAGRTLWRASRRSRHGSWKSWPAGLKDGGTTTAAAGPAGLRSCRRCDSSSRRERTTDLPRTDPSHSRPPFPSPPAAGGPATTKPFALDGPGADAVAVAALPAAAAIGTTHGVPLDDPKSEGGGGATFANQGRSPRARVQISEPRGAGQRGMGTLF